MHVPEDRERQLAAKMIPLVSDLLHRRGIKFNIPPHVPEDRERQPAAKMIPLVSDLLHRRGIKFNIPPHVPEDRERQPAAKMIPLVSDLLHRRGIKFNIPPHVPEDRERQLAANMPLRELLLSKGHTVDREYFVFPDLRCRSILHYGDRLFAVLYASGCDYNFGDILF